MHRSQTLHGLTPPHCWKKTKPKKIHMTHDMWHVTRDMRHMSCDTWQVLKILSQVQLLSASVWEWSVKAFLRKKICDSTNKGVCRTGPATPGLLKTEPVFKGGTVSASRKTLGYLCGWRAAAPVRLAPSAHLSDYKDYYWRGLTVKLNIFRMFWRIALRLRTNFTFWSYLKTDC